MSLVAAIDEQDRQFIKEFVAQHNLSAVSLNLIEVFLQEYLKSKERRVKDSHALAAEQLQAIAMKHGKGRR